MKYKISLILIVIFALASCNKKSATKEVNFQKLFSIEVPIEMQKSKTLNSQASIQMVDNSNELYVIVLTEPKLDVIAKLDELGKSSDNVFYTYASISYNSLLQTVQTSSNHDLKKKMTNGLPAYVVNFDANVSGLDIFYNFSCIEGVDSYYQILAWTLKANESKQVVEMTNIINSFKELK